MKIFGTIYPFVETNNDSYRLGRYVANFEFLRALLTANRFDEYHLFCMNPSHAKLTIEKLQGVELQDEVLQKIRVFQFTDLVPRLKVTEYHVFHLGGWGYFFSGLSHLRNRYAQKPFPITGIIHSMNGLETNYHAHKIIFAPLLPYDTVICSSRAGEQVFQNILSKVSAALESHGTRVTYTGGTHMIPLAVDDRFATSRSSTSCRKQLNLPADAFIVLMVGRFSVQSKMDLYPALQCHKKMQSASLPRPVFLVMAGGGATDELNIVKSIVDELDISASTRIIANFNDDTKAMLYQAADVYLSVTDNLQETFGISVVEAMMAGKPAVISDINGYKELIEDGIHGYKIPTTWIQQFETVELAEIMNFNTMQLMLSQCMAIDTEHLFNALCTLASDAENTAQMGAAAKEHATKRFSWSSVMVKYHELWDSLHANILKLDESELKTLRSMPNPFINDYLNAFDHYPTHKISPEMWCRITPDGKDALAQGRVPAAYSDIRELLHVDYQGAVLRTIEQHPLKVETLIENRLAGLSESDAQFNLLWLAKYGLVALRTSLDD
ncbi:MAG: glycosyltransferase family 4 protein [Deltaproteobacteria bacterium]|nr:glycosyltransferase family 4 protein [Deltaproteobacteria bacterium]MBN2671824.1 glycosyltransferase family 4 protein [Deltaproteobacteria bacterium]